MDERQENLVFTDLVLSNLILILVTKIDHCIFQETTLRCFLHPTG